MQRNPSQDAQAVFPFISGEKQLFAGTRFRLEPEGRRRAAEQRSYLMGPRRVGPHCAAPRNCSDMKKCRFGLLLPL